MTLLVSLDQAKAHLHVDTDADDEDITLKVHVASASVLAYLKDAAYAFTDTSGEVLEDSSGPVDVPYQVQMATLLMLGTLYASRGEDGGALAQFTQGFLPPAVTALLYPLRDPALA